VIGDLYWTSVVSGGWVSGNPSDAMEHVAEVPLPAVGTLITPEYALTKNRLNLKAVVEPDVDGDGFGDETQDLCPRDLAIHTACPKPVISGMRFFHSSFYVNKSGAPIAASAGKGSKLTLTLSAASTVNVTVNRRASGRKVGSKCVKPSSKNHSKKSCTYEVKQWSFSKLLPAGASSIAFPGTARVGGHTKSLSVASYDATAVAVSTLTGTAGDRAVAKFAVVAAPKSKHH
jgi:hypothetical protein